MHEPDSPSEGHVGEGEIDAGLRERNSDEREAALDAREDSIRAREATSADRVKEVGAILDDAHERDHQADARDARAEERDKAASLQSFLHDEDFTPGVKARQAAGIDRSDSKHDRTSAADDRSKLTEDARRHSNEEHSEDLRA